MPPELAAIVSRLPGFRIHPTADGGWSGRIQINRDRRGPQHESFVRAWRKVKETLTKTPWTVEKTKHDGWNGQTETGGNYSRKTQVFNHPDSDLHVEMTDSTSFGTGTTHWVVTAWKGNEFLEDEIEDEEEGLGESARRAPLRGGMLLEGHVRITPEEMQAWMGGDWGYVAEGASLMAKPIGVDEAAAWARENFDDDGTDATESAVDVLGCPPDEVEFGLGAVKGKESLVAAGGLTGLATHVFTGTDWDMLPRPIPIS